MTNLRQTNGTERDSAEFVETNSELFNQILLHGISQRQLVISLIFTQQNKIYTGERQMCSSKTQKQSNSILWTQVWY